MQPPPSGPAGPEAATPEVVLVRAAEYLSYLVATQPPGWDREARLPYGSGEWLAVLAELTRRSGPVLHHVEVRQALRGLLDAYERWEAAAEQTDVRYVARPPPR